MKFFKFIGLTSIAWSLRRLYCPVKSSDLVLEVGSGGNPYFRSNVLLDAYEETRERHWVPLVQDRPTVLGFVEHLPFRDKAFDFVIASHVLEHSTAPVQFLSELQRVAKAGYIEVPDAFMERINPYRDHRLEITVREGRLLIRKKNDWKVDAELVEMYEDRVKSILTTQTMRQQPFQFHVRYYWKDTIDFEVLNPEVEASWDAPESNSSPMSIPGMKKGVRLGLRQKLGGHVLKWIRNVFSQKGRNGCLDLADLMNCPQCRGIDFSLTSEQVRCNACEAIYPVRSGIPVMYPPVASSTTGA